MNIGTFNGRMYARAENTDFGTDGRVANQALNIGANTSRYFH